MFDGDIAITPFNLKEEQQEGSFSKDGNENKLLALIAMTMIQ